MIVFSLFFAVPVVSKPFVCFAVCVLLIILGTDLTYFCGRWLQRVSLRPVPAIYDVLCSVPEKGDPKLSRQITWDYQSNQSSIIQSTRLTKLEDSCWRSKFLFSFKKCRNGYSVPFTAHSTERFNPQAGRSESHDHQIIYLKAYRVRKT